MLGRVLVAAVAGVVLWKYRDALREYARGNEGPAREKLADFLQTVQERSETLLDKTKRQVSSRLDDAREKLRGGTSGARRDDIPGSSFRA